MLSITPALVALLFTTAQERAAIVPLTPERATSIILNPATYSRYGLSHLIVSMFQASETQLLNRLRRLNSENCPLRDFKNITNVVARFHDARAIDALINKLGVIYLITDSSDPFSSSDRWRIAYPAAEALASIGDPVIKPLLDTFARAADDPAKHDVCGNVIIALVEGIFVAKSLKMAQARLDTNSNDKRVVRVYEKLIAMLAFNDRNDEIADFKAKLPSSWWKSWWDKFKEEEQRAQAAKKKRIR